MPFLFISLLIISACSLNESNNVEEQFLKRVAHPQSTKILHIENHVNGKIYLYEDKSGFRASFYKEKEDYFQSTSNAEANPEDGFSWTMANNPDLVLFAGVITDEQIEKVIVKQRTFEQMAKIINIIDGKRYWFTTFDVLEESVNGEGDPLKIEAFDKEGNLYWKSGVYKDGLFQGRTNN